MKLNAQKFLAFAAIAGIAFTACKKSNHNNAPLSATVNGASFNAKTLTIVHDGNNNEFDVAGLQYGKDTAAITLFFTDQFTINKAFSDDTADIEMQYFPTFATFNSGGYGGNGDWYESTYSSANTIVTITSWDQSKKTIAGTFYGSATSTSGGADSVTIKSGKFSGTYTEQ